MEDSEWYKSALDSMRDLVLIKGPNSALLWANKAFLDYYGMTNEQLRDIIDGPQSDPDDTLQYVKDDLVVFETGNDLNVPSEPVTNSKNEVHYYHTVKSPIFDAGKVVRSIGVSRPISDDAVPQQKISDLDVKVFTAPLRSIIDTLPIKAMLLDKNARVVKCNERWAKRIGSVPENTSESFEHYLPELTPLAQEVSQALKNNVELEKVIEMKLDKKKLFFDFKVSPWKYPDGSVGGTLVIATDVTAAMQKEREVGLLAHRLTLALEASQVGVWEWDVKKEELFWDESMVRLYGIQDKDFTSAREAFYAGLHPDEVERTPRELQGAIISGQKFNVEFRIYWPTGELRTLRAIADTVKDEAGNPSKLIGVSWDITDEKNYERTLRMANTDLERANAELQQFSYRSSHDLKGPLTTIRSLTEFMLEDFEEGKLEEVKSNIEVIGQQAESLETLVLDLLALAKTDLIGETDETIDFEGICQEVLLLNEGLAAENGVEISWVIEMEKEWQLPKARILQIVNNLVSNGIKYANRDLEKRFVKISIKEKQDKLIIEVDDNGIGIPCEDKSEVFSMFKRFHSKEISGSGIGMYIVKKHLDIMQGEIDFDTSGSGTCFRIALDRNAE